ncbi:MAG: ABC transporter ATP-binding protein [Chitinophagales bacterium]|nr:ABC transporter ATP-binding protein [Chitinophagales bacterium]
MDNLLQVKSLSISYRQSDGYNKNLLKDVHFDIHPGEILCLTGLSGSGKSLTALSLIGLSDLAKELAVSGLINFEGNELSLECDDQWTQLRGNEISIIFQNPHAALNPVKRCLDQIKESLTIHHPDWDGLAINNRVSELLAMTKLNEIPHIEEAYPHQLSGGQLQRVVIAMALANHPKLIIADEAVSSLDRDTALDIIYMLTDICREENVAMLFISHDLGVIESIADSVVLIQGGIVEEKIDLKNGAVSTIETPYQGYKVKLHQVQLEKKNTPSGSEVLRVEHISKSFPKDNTGFYLKSSAKPILKNIALSIKAGEMLGVYGVSGSGKTTLARVIAGLTNADSGSLFFHDTAYDYNSLQGDSTLRKKIQMVLQGSGQSLQPKMKIRTQCREIASMYYRGKEVDDSLNYWFEYTGLTQDLWDKYPSQLSGGQQQRVAFIKALIPKPDLIIFDESLSALDQYHQNILMGLILKLQHDQQFAGIFISHDIRLIESICHRSIQLVEGQIVNEKSYL